MVLIYALLVGFGWVNIYAASFTEENSALLDFSMEYGKQLLWITLAIPIIIFTLFINSKFYEQFASIFYLICILSLLGLFVLGTEVNGAKSWYRFGSIGLQPSEFAKAFTALAIAKLLSDRKYNLGLIKNQIKAFIVIFLPAALIAVHDAGSAIVYLAFFFVLNREGLTLAYIILGTLAIILFVLTILLGVKILIISICSLISIYLFYSIYRDKRFLRFNWLKIASMYIFSIVFIFIIPIQSL